MKRPTSPEDVQKVFDCYCKKILKNEAINIQKHYQRMNDLQISFSELMPEQLVELSTYDDYSTDYDLYKVMGYDVKIKNELLPCYRFRFTGRYSGYECCVMPLRAIHCPLVHANKH